MKQQITGLNLHKLQHSRSSYLDNSQALRSRRHGSARHKTAAPGSVGAVFKNKKLRLILAVIILLLLAKFIYSTFNSSSSMFRYVFAGQSTLKSVDNRVNILLLGYGGASHDGPYLTDSIIVLSYNLKTHLATMFSLPRDLWVPGVEAKVNTLYQTGKDQGDGLKYAEDKIGSIMGIPIQYGFGIDFAGFAKAIDLIGGVDVNVPKTFDDYQYPVEGKENDLCGLTQKVVEVTPPPASASASPLPSSSPETQTVYIDQTGKVATGSALTFPCRFEHLHFDQGLTHLDGITALKFVRSRHGDNGEGSDFARSRRQQLVIQAFKSKVLSAGTLSNPQKVAGLISTLGQSIDTDIPSQSYLELYNLAKDTQHINSVVLGDLGNGKSLFINPPISNQYGGAWVLVPPNNDFSTVTDFVQQTLNQDVSPAPTPK